MPLLAQLTDFIERGGNVLPFILFVSTLLWSLICERLMYFNYTYPRKQQHWLEEWQKHPRNNLKHAYPLRKYLLSKASICLHKNIRLIKTLIALCPLLGLLGTVTGMIHVFDVMAITGNNNPRAMATGISQATISTMAGMVIALSGLYFHALIEKTAQNKLHKLKEAMSS